ncbi:NAD(P)/FAD-dependent oxidoreductase [Longimicrobium sp.]|uniref:NAD(P)/FAD-dependent oxidoreductase n=1 Tax=Longimicrobium sp. TaxID=2029185 RepID=UPI002B50B583|nr:NAD(P)/FAD-dependent oxidoreductase [Longimicrobium sp.]HSU13892.1 NAD(P)/FAD-dependent oxidoreductase [Longimicrobium sp.]
MSTYDVVVIGAGLAGLETARRLAGRGQRVLLVDQKTALDRSVHTTGIFVRRTLEDFDLPEDCLGPPVRHVVLYSPRGRALPLESARTEYRVGRMGALYGRMLDSCVAAGVEWAPGTRFAGLLDDGTHSVVVLETGGRGWSARARLVVGADGAASRVAPALGLSVNREWIVGVEEVFRVSTDGPPCFHCWLDPELAPGYLAWVVADGEEVHLGVGGYAARFQPADALRRFRERVEDRFGLRGKMADERRGGRIPVGGVLPRIASPRGLLVGDAAGAVSPLTAGGLDPCIRLSALAARVAADFIATGDEASLTAYSGGAFRRRFRSRLLLRRALAAVRSPLAAEIAIAALRSPLLRPLASHVFFGRGSFPDTGEERGITPITPRSVKTGRAQEASVA